MGGGAALAYGYSGSMRDRLAGMVVWSPMIDFAPQARPFTVVEAAGKLLAKIMPNMKMVNKLDDSAMSRDPSVVADYNADKLCHNTGTLLGLSEMLERSRLLRSPGVQASFPQNLPVLVMHGSGDRITSHEASKSFVEGLGVVDKTFKQYDGWYHKLHADEPGEDRVRFANDVVAWINGRCPAGGVPKL